jgi:hypothetical protein
MAVLHRASWPLAVVLLASMAALLVPGVMQAEEDKKPSLSLKANPPVGFSPLKVRLVVDVRGGPNDYEEFYCAGTTWAWGDGTESASEQDCEPYKAGVSEIKRRHSVEHIFRQAGNYRISFRLTQRDKVIATTSTSIQVRAGVRDGFGD